MTSNEIINVPLSINEIHYLHAILQQKTRKDDIFYRLSLILENETRRNRIENGDGFNGLEPMD